MTTLDRLCNSIVQIGAEVGLDQLTNGLDPVALRDFPPLSRVERYHGTPTGTSPLLVINFMVAFDFFHHEIRFTIT